MRMAREEKKTRQEILACAGRIHMQTIEKAFSSS